MATLYEPSLRRLAALACALAMGTAAAGCTADEDNSSHVETPMALRGIASSATPSAVALTHGPDGCVQSLTATYDSADVQSTLMFTARKSFGLALTKYADTKSGEIWELSGGDAWLPLHELDAGYDKFEGGAMEVAVNKLLVWPRGTAKQKRTAGGDSSRGDATERNVDMSDTQFGGDVISALDPKATCKRCDDSNPDCKAPFPTWRLRDFQSESPRKNLRYDMNALLGAPFVTILTQGW